MDLHELAAENMKTAFDQTGNREDRYLLRQQFLLPVFQILADDIPEAALINRIQSFKLLGSRRVSFICIDDSYMVI